MCVGHSDHQPRTGMASQVPGAGGWEAGTTAGLRGLRPLTVSPSLPLPSLRDSYTFIVVPISGFSSPLWNLEGDKP